MPLVTALPAFHEGLGSLEGELVLLASIVVSIGVIWTKVIRPIIKGTMGVVGDVREMKELADSFPERFDCVTKEIGKNAERMDRVESRADVLADELGKIRGSLEVLSSQEAVLTRQALHAHAHQLSPKDGGTERRARERYFGDDLL